MIPNPHELPHAMLRKTIVLLIIAGLSALARFINRKYDSVELDKIVYTLLALTFSYFIFRFLLEELAAKYLHHSKARYSFRKAVSLLFIAVSFVVILRTWIINPQLLLVAYGLVAAGVAISFQDIFKNFAGGIIIFLTGSYQAGNRIAINGKFGDVIDMGLFTRQFWKQLKNPRDQNRIRYAVDCDRCEYWRQDLIE